MTTDSIQAQNTPEIKLSDVDELISFLRSWQVRSIYPHHITTLRVMRERIEELEAAVLPFAKEYDNWSVDRTPDELSKIDGEKAFDETDFLVSDFRRARSATKREG